MPQQNMRGMAAVVSAEHLCKLWSLKDQLPCALVKVESDINVCSSHIKEPTGLPVRNASFPYIFTGVKQHMIAAWCCQHTMLKHVW